MGGNVRYQRQTQGLIAFALAAVVLAIMATSAKFQFIG